LLTKDTLEGDKPDFELGGNGVFLEKKDQKDGQAKSLAD